MKASMTVRADGGLRLLPWAFPLFLLLLSAIVSSRIVQERSRAAGAAEGQARKGSLLFEISRRPAFALGFRNFLADIAWLGAVQVSGSVKMSRGDYDRLAVLVQAVGNLDPRFVVPYLLGGIILGDSPDHVEEALKTLRRGMENHPTDWRFPFYIGYIQYFAFGSPAEGGKSLEAAARIPGSPPYLPLLAARMLSEGREPGTALAFLSGLIKAETDPARIEVLRKRVKEVIVERDIQALENAVAAFKAGTGRAPGALSELVAAGLVRRIPAEPHGGTYLLDPDGTVRSSRLADRLKVFRKP